MALIPPVLVAIFASSPWPVFVLLFLIVVIGDREIQEMLPSGRSVVMAASLLFALVGLLAVRERPFDGSSLAAIGAASWLVGLILTVLVVRGRLTHRVFGAFGSLWVAGPALTLLALHGTPNAPIFQTSTPVLLAVLPLWGGDTAAIFAGKAFGKHKLAPTISPKKTWEGGIANLLACVLVAVPLAHGIGYSWSIGVACGLAAGVLGQAGDLFESWVKRQAGVKDSGTLLPGHGGIMDRIDSILFTAPAVALITMLAR